MSNSSYQSAIQIPTRCKCGVPVSLRQSWTSRNPGRRYVQCKFYNREDKDGSKGCMLWEWIDNPQQQWQKLVINQLILEKQLLEREIEELKVKAASLERELEKTEKKNEKLAKKLQKLEVEGHGGRNVCVNVSCCSFVIVALLCFFIAVFK